jgi:hypothetical protein
MATDSQLLEGRALSDCLILMDSPGDRREAIDRMTRSELHKPALATFASNGDLFHREDDLGI